MNVTLSITATSQSDLDVLSQILDLLPGDIEARFEQSVKGADEKPAETKPARRKPGRPRKTDADKPKRKRKPGRPRKNPEPELWEDADDNGGDDDEDDPLGEESPAEVKPKKEKVADAELPTRKQMFSLAKAFIESSSAEEFRKVLTAMGLDVLADIKPKQHDEMATRLYEACKDDEVAESLRLAAGIVG